MIEANKVYEMDCLELMKKLPDKYFDLIITDPPYGITKADWDKVQNKEVFDEMFRVSKNQIIFGGHYMDLPKKDGWIIWNKLPFLKTTNQAELIWTSFLKKNIIIEFRFAGNCVGSKKPDYNRKKVIFTSEKPIEIAELILSKFAKEGDLIFDPFAGSGSFLVACKQLGFDYVGCEINKDYVELCNKRLDFTTMGDFLSPKGESLIPIKSNI